MKSLAFLEFTFLFDPSETWESISTLEKDLASFLETKGLEAEVIMPAGINNRRVLFIRKIPDNLDKIAVGLSTKEPSQILKTMAANRDLSGQFKKNNK